eukprot:TRINITY_DN15230_c0_g1_i1.p1 TRINITY_DN15230_c0_g1~~TRINITY_DN15230_c0_g1_i1.p1  ORF type:complete len:51 (-),score=6.18 TRINITY_DN15230_c0_g1_i1:23-175(-)
MGINRKKRVLICDISDVLCVSRISTMRKQYLAFRKNWKKSGNFHEDTTFL